MLCGSAFVQVTIIIAVDVQCKHYIYLNRFMQIRRSLLATSYVFTCSTYHCEPLVVLEERCRQPWLVLLRAGSALALQIYNSEELSRYKCYNSHRSLLNCTKYLTELHQLGGWTECTACGRCCRCNGSSGCCGYQRWYLLR